VKVYLHIGAGKTGTSAIQVALAQHREALAAAGVLYPVSAHGSDRRAARGEISSGNAIPLGRFTNPGAAPEGFDAEGVLSWVQGCVAEAAGRDLLFSSESMQFTRPDRAARLVETFRAAGYEPVVIFYVRHLLDAAVAEYQQFQKLGLPLLRGGQRVGSLGEFLRQYRCRYLQSLEPFAALLPREALRVRLYEAEREALIPNFFAIVSDVVPPAAAREKVVNRSLAPEELPVFERLGALPDGPRLCRLLTDTLLNAPPLSRTPVCVPEAEFAAFEALNLPILERINAEFLAGPDRLRLRSDRIAVGQPAPVELDQVYGVVVEYLAATLRRAEAVRPDHRPGPETAGTT
jgi:hypothetical protein